MSTDEFDVKQSIAAEAGVIDEAEQESSLEQAIAGIRLLPENAIAIPPSSGARFQALFDEGLRSLSNRYKQWENNIKLFQDDTEAMYAKENIIRTTVESLVDYTYMRNPTISLATENEEDKPFTKLVEKIVRTLINKKTAPGINLRPKVQKQIIYGHLTNFGILELGFQSEKGSIEDVLSTMDKVRQAVKEEEDVEEAGRLFELLDILQREVQSRNYMGISVRHRSPFSIIFDPNTTELDLSDCKWAMDRDVMPIDHIKAEYMVKDPETGQYFFKYKPDVEFSFDKPSVQSKETTEVDIINQIMPDTDEDIAALRVKNTVPIVRIYDRTTQLIYLYMEGRWDVPLWVYPNEMELSRFFPFFILGFSTVLQSIVQKGEVEHYIPHQNELNRINRKVAQVRSTAFTKYVYNSAAIDKKEAESFMKFLDSGHDKERMLGIKLRDNDVKLEDAFAPIKLPAAQFQEIFDKQDLHRMIESTTRVSEVIRGGQFKTNTTNDAISTYNEQTGNRLEGLTDKIEGCAEDIIWAICELVVSKMSPAQVSDLLTVEEAQQFRNMSVRDFNKSYSITVAAGSTEKPTSANKKKEATQIIQMLGQFGTAAPRTVISVVARLLRDVFSPNMVTDKDLQTLEEEGQANMQKGISTPQQQGQVPPKGVK